MAPLLIAVLPFLLLPALLAVLGNAAALSFAGFATGLLLLVVAAQLAIGIARLWLLCLGGFAALGAAIMPLFTLDLGWPAAVALAMTPVPGCLVGLLLWWVLRRLAPAAAAPLTLFFLLPLAALPSITFDAVLTLPAFVPGGLLVWPVATAVLLLMLAGRFAGSPAVQWHEATLEANLPLAGQGFDPAVVGAVALGLASALAALGGAIMALGAAPIIGGAPADWAALSIAVYAIGRLGGARLGGALLAALPLALMPKLITIIAPGFLDLTLVMAVAALVLQLVVRQDGTLAWRPRRRAQTGLGVRIERVVKR